MSQPVLGWAFCRNYKLSLVWNLFDNLELWDRIAQIKAPLEIKAQKHGAWQKLKGYNVHYVNLAPKATCSFGVSDGA